MRATVYEYQHHITGESRYTLTPLREDSADYGAACEVELPEGYDLYITREAQIFARGPKGTPLEAWRDKTGTYRLIPPRGYEWDEEWAGPRPSIPVKRVSDAGPRQDVGYQLVQGWLASQESR